jgi:hypothetical protein
MKLNLRGSTRAKWKKRINSKRGWVRLWFWVT